MPTWKELTPILVAERFAGATLDQLAQRHGVNKGSISRALKAAATATQPDTELQPATAQQTDAQGGNKKAWVDAKESGLQALSDRLDKDSARKTLNEIALGHREGDASQMAALRLVLKDELEPESESNPYAGTPEEELGERALVLACSVLGYRSVVARLRELGKAEMLDLLGDEDAEPPEALELDRPVIAHADDEGPSFGDSLRAEGTPLMVEAPRAPRAEHTGDLEVEDLGEA